LTFDEAWKYKRVESIRLDHEKGIEKKTGKLKVDVNPNKISYATENIINQFGRFEYILYL